MSDKDTIILERRFVPENTMIMSEGDEGNCAYLIQSGSVQVFTESNGRKLELAKLELGQIFGEMALVFDAPRTASVRTLEDSNLIVITRDVLNEKLRRSDSTVRALVEMLIKRMVTANNAIVNKKSDINDLKETTQIIYQNVINAMPEDKQNQFQAEVFPKLEDFMKALKKFP